MEQAPLSDGAGAPYDEFAWLYDRHWGPHSLQKFAPILEAVLLPRLPAQARVLDLCCGTGQITHWLTQRGHRVTGLDQSKAMLRFAEERDPESSFVHADARAFSLPPIHDAAVSLFDSLNHILSPPELAGAFHCVHAALKPGGLFFCDFNVRQKFLAGWKGDFSIVEEDHVCIVRTRYEDLTRLAQWEITLFRREKQNWERANLVLTQRAYEEDEVCRALAEAGFADSKCWDSIRAPEGGWPLPPGKTFFMGRKAPPRSERG